MYSAHVTSKRSVGIGIGVPHASERLASPHKLDGRKTFTADAPNPRGIGGDDAYANIPLGVVNDGNTTARMPGAVSLAHPGIMSPSSLAGQPSKADSGVLRFREFRVAAGRFVVKRHLGGGSFGEIYAGIDTWRDCEVALKFEMIKARRPQLALEYRVYRYLHPTSQDVVGIPEVHWFGTEGDYNIMAMDMCGPCLEDLFMYCERKFSIKTVCMLAEQMLHRIEYVHSRQFLHRDIKAENFVMGVRNRGHHVCLLDFGLAKRYWDTRTMQHIPYKEGKALTGTTRYCSVNVHLGLEQSRRDDLESIGYLLIYFAKGSLPWQGVRAQDAQNKIVRIGEKKVNVSLESLCRDLPQAFYQYVRYSRMLRFEETPDYTWCRQLFRQLMEKEGTPYDWTFDWVDRRRRELDHQMDRPYHDHAVEQSGYGHGNLKSTPLASFENCSSFSTNRGLASMATVSSHGNRDVADHLTS